jgi:N-acetylmuramoyl-L-alanine amidase
VLVGAVVLASALAACTNATAPQRSATEPAATSVTGTAAPTTAPTSAPAPSTSSTTSSTTVPPPPQLTPGTLAVRTPSGILGLWYGHEDADRYIVSTPCERRISVPVAASTVVRGIDVLLDPGHGGLDPGARAPSGMDEAELNLDVALRVAALLRAGGVRVELTRDDDYYRSIADRAQLALALSPKAFVSIHHNSGIDAPARNGIGTEIYHQAADPEARRLGGLLYESLEARLGALDAAWTRSARWGVRARTNSGGTDFYGVLRRSAGVPAVIVEAAYLSSAREAELLATERFRAAEAQALADGIRRWLTTPDPGGGYQPGFVEDGTGGFSDLRSCRDPSLDQPRR